MTAEAFAELVRARRTGAGKWTARCPAHNDKHPSLTVSQGDSGVLLHCWSQGCTVDQVCAALGLSVKDLFNDANLTPAQVAEATWQKAIRDAEQARHHAIAHDRSDRMCKLQALVHVLGAMLARRPDDAELARLFHLACDRLHEAETIAFPPHEDGPKRLEVPTAVSAEMTAALSEIGRSFDGQQKRRPAETDRRLRIA